jgi:hypothetical protein
MSQNIQYITKGAAADFTDCFVEHGINYTTVLRVSMSYMFTT